MKHLKLFEKKEQNYYLFDYFIIESDEHQYKLFPDLESCHLYFLDIVNEERRDLEGDSYDDETMFFTSVKEASEWYYTKSDNEVEIGWDKVEVQDKYIPSEELRLKIDAKKYNL